MAALSIRSRGYIIFRSVLAVAATIATVPAISAPIPYGFTLSVQSAHDLTLSSCAAPSIQYFPCSTAPGDSFRGSFWIDDAFLKNAGTAISAPVTGFMLRIGSIVWDQDHPSDFRGLRDGLTYQSGGNALSFDISNGVITGISGGVWGQSDPPYLDFVKGGTFAALDPAGRALEGLVVVAPAAVAEPTTAALMLSAAGLFATRRRRKMQASMAR